MLLLFRTAYLYTMIIYTACAVLGFNGASIGLVATATLAVGSEISFMYNEKEETNDEKELRYVV